ncbi:hypothetical protein MNV49_003583 [Pseudohyphozyma bogoriensis]|nr:hypothetical protein MNV49_003583 [Pseudohyphozyma bogoriensis]
MPSFTNSSASTSAILGIATTGLQKVAEAEHELDWVQQELAKRRRLIDFARDTEERAYHLDLPDTDIDFSHQLKPMIISLESCMGYRKTITAAQQAFTRAKNLAQMPSKDLEAAGMHPLSLEELKKEFEIIEVVCNSLDCTIWTIRNAAPSTEAVYEVLSDVDKAIRVATTHEKDGLGSQQLARHVSRRVMLAHIVLRVTGVSLSRSGYTSARPVLMEVLRRLVAFLVSLVPGLRRHRRTVDEQHELGQPSSIINPTPRLPLELQRQIALTSLPPPNLSSNFRERYELLRTYSLVNWEWREFTLLEMLRHICWPTEASAERFRDSLYINCTAPALSGGAVLDLWALVASTTTAHVGSVSFEGKLLMSRLLGYLILFTNLRTLTLSNVHLGTLYLLSGCESLQDLTLIKCTFTGSPLTIPSDDLTPEQWASGLPHLKKLKAFHTRLLPTGDHTGPYPTFFPSLEEAVMIFSTVVDQDAGARTLEFWDPLARGGSYEDCNTFVFENESYIFENSGLVETLPTRRPFTASLTRFGVTSTNNLAAHLSCLPDQVQLKTLRICRSSHLNCAEATDQVEALVSLLADPPRALDSLDRLVLPNAQLVIHGEAAHGVETYGNPEALVKLRELCRKRKVDLVEPSRTPLQLELEWELFDEGW